MSRIFCDYCGGTDWVELKKQPDGTYWCDSCCQIRCDICGTELKPDEEIFCNHPSCIEKRAEKMFG